MKKFTTFILLILVSTTVSANVIFPAFSAPYVSALLFPVVLVAVLVVEGAIYKYLNKTLSLLKIALLVVVANIVSWIAGMAITSLLPSGLVANEQGIITSGPEFSMYATLGFGIAYVLSIIIEAAVLKLISLKMSLVSPIKMSFYSNTASYIVLSVMVWGLK